MDSNVTECLESVAISWLSCLEILMFTCSLVRMFNGLSLKSDITFMDETLALVFDVVPIHLHKIGFKDSHPQLFSYNFSEPPLPSADRLLAFLHLSYKNSKSSIVHRTTPIPHHHTTTPPHLHTTASLSCEQRISYIRLYNPSYSPSPVQRPNKRWISITMKK